MALITFEVMALDIGSLKVCSIGWSRSFPGLKKFLKARAPLSDWSVREQHAG